MLEDVKGRDIALYLSGQPVPVAECNVIIYQPTIREVVVFGEDDFLSMSQMFGKTKSFLESVKQGNPGLVKMEDFQILLTVIQQDVQMQGVLQQYFDLILPAYNIAFNDNDIQFFLKDGGNLVGMINPFNFSYFSKAINNLFLINNGNDVKEVEYNPVDAKAAEIAEKIKAGRAKRKSMNAKADEKSSLFGTYISILSIGMGMDMNVLFKYTPFQIYDTFVRYWAKSSSDFYQKVSTTPMMDTSKMKQPEEWTRNLY